MSLELKKFKAELLRVQAAKAEMEYIIEQKMDEVERLNNNIKIHDDKEKEIQEKLNNLK